MAREKYRHVPIVRSVIPRISSAVSYGNMWESKGIKSPRGRSGEHIVELIFGLGFVLFANVRIQLINGPKNHGKIVSKSY